MEQTKGLVEFKDVSFRYDGAETDILEHISFTAKPDRPQPLSASTGSGQIHPSTLIPRFDDVTQGSITIDGVDVREIPQQELRDKIGYVPQKVCCFPAPLLPTCVMRTTAPASSSWRKAHRWHRRPNLPANWSRATIQSISQGGTNVFGRTAAKTVHRACTGRKGADLYL